MRTEKNIPKLLHFTRKWQGLHILLMTEELLIFALMLLSMEKEQKTISKQVGHTNALLNILWQYQFLGSRDLQRVQNPSAMREFSGG